MSELCFSSDALASASWSVLKTSFSSDNGEVRVIDYIYRQGRKYAIFCVRVGIAKATKLIFVIDLDGTFLIYNRCNP